VYNSTHTQQLANVADISLQVTVLHRSADNY